MWWPFSLGASGLRGGGERPSHQDPCLRETQPLSEGGSTVGVSGTICFLSAGREDGPIEWSLPEFWEDFLEDVVPED